jgi:ATP-dependent helicase/nuclease subunit B
MDRVIAGSENVYVSLCCDSLVSKGETDLFANVKKAGRRLRDIASSHGIAVSEEVVENKNFSDDILALESFLSENSQNVFEASCDNVKICAADSVYDEVDFVMNTIRKLVREQGLRYRDFVLISRSDSVYSPLIDEVSSLYKIPCYTDNRVAMTSLPFTVFMISSVKAALSFETEDIMRMAKTGLAGVDDSEISKVENYAYIWNVDGKKWLEKWNMNPDGLKSVTTEKEAERFKKELDVINDIRERIILPLI